MISIIIHQTRNAHKVLSTIFPFVCKTCEGRWGCYSSHDIIIILNPWNWCHIPDPFAMTARWKRREDLNQKGKFLKFCIIFSRQNLITPDILSDDTHFAQFFWYHRTSSLNNQCAVRAAIIIIIWFFTLGYFFSSVDGQRWQGNLCSRTRMFCCLAFFFLGDTMRCWLEIRPNQRPLVPYSANFSDANIRWYKLNTHKKRKSDIKFDCVRKKVDKTFSFVSEKNEIL
jgi:hypothetical protein